ncbi:MAG: YkgJ family cysteine cluster protein [Akkermansiaceae bacterium]|jgi:Fe-S-cluster containining protein|nr:YkgJ family cysteine cluster protein [Akkermansiaceae bacterium]
MKRDPTLKQKLREVRAIYDEWSSRPLERQCVGRADCCRFKLVGHTPYLTRGEALVAAMAWRAAGRKEIPSPADGSCPFLHPANGRCQIYEGRPFGCRTHFCAPAGGPAKREEVRDLIQRLEEIDRQLDGDGPVSLPIALARALKDLR